MPVVNIRLKGNDHTRLKPLLVVFDEIRLLLVPPWAHAMASQRRYICLLLGITIEQDNR